MKIDKGQILLKIRAAAMSLVRRPSASQPQTARRVNIDITPDGKAKMVGYLPEQPTGRAIIDCPGGGYNHPAMNRAGIPCALYVYPSGGHGFGFRTSWLYHDQMLGDLREWLKTLKAKR